MAFHVEDELTLREHHGDLVAIATALPGPRNFTRRKRHAIVFQICHNIPSAVGTIALGIRLV